MPEKLLLTSLTERSRTLESLKRQTLRTAPPRLPATQMRRIRASSMTLATAAGSGVGMTAAAAAANMPTVAATMRLMADSAAGMAWGVLWVRKEAQRVESFGTADDPARAMNSVRRW